MHAFNDLCMFLNAFYNTHVLLLQWYKYNVLTWRYRVRILSFARSLCSLFSPIFYVFSCRRRNALRHSPPPNPHILRYVPKFRALALFLQLLPLSLATPMVPPSVCRYISFSRLLCIFVPPFTPVYPVYSASPILLHIPPCSHTFMLGRTFPCSPLLARSLVFLFFGSSTVFFYFRY